MGVTRYCLESALVRELGLRPVGGTKNPDVEEILSRRPDAVVVCNEENRIEDVEEMRSAGARVVEISPRSVEDAAEGVLRLGELTGLSGRAEELAGDIEEARTEAGKRAADLRWVSEIRIFCPIWYRPWMSFSCDTYCNAVLEACGARNVYAGRGPERYFVVDPGDAVRLGAGAVLLPTEPFRFGPRHAEVLEKLIGPAVIVEGSALTWYGARTPWGLGKVSAALRELDDALGD